MFSRTSRLLSLLFLEFSGFYILFSFQGSDILSRLASLNIQRRRRDLNPRAATNDLLPFQGSPFNLLGTSAWLNLVSYSIYIRRQITKTRLQRRGWDSNPRALADKRFSRPPRYDHFDTSPNALFHFTEVSTFCQVLFLFFQNFIFLSFVFCCCSQRQLD